VLRRPGALCDSYGSLERSVVTICAEVGEWEGGSSEGLGGVMGLFRRRNAVVSVPAQPTGTSSARKLVDIVIVGEASYQPHIRTVARRHPDKFEIELCAEPQNPYDANAVAVFADGKVVGYLPREMAAWWQPAVLAAKRTGGPVRGVAQCFGGSGTKENIGVFGGAYWPGPGDPMPRSEWEKYTDYSGTRRR
jgi:hypothetical protein